MTGVIERSAAKGLVETGMLPTSVLTLVILR